MTKEMIEKFLNPKINKGKGQLIFSSHDASTLDFLKKYEVHIVSKDADGVTTVRRVDGFPGIRNTHDLKKMYLQGVLGGLPQIQQK